MSDMDSDCDDVFTDDSKGPSLQDDDNCHMINRKRRRGIIEKRRRDRINNSLTELRRLVPAAFEKQGSAKLEKAEILQMTVDHLKILHSKGMDSFTFESQKFTMDYHGLGFRECTAEIARYLVGMEGRDLQDPLRMRLMSHLQCFAAQRDLALKSSSPSWTSGNSLFGTLPAVPTPQYPSGHPSIPSPLSERIFSSPYSSSSNSDVLRLSSNRASSSSSSLMSTDSVRSPGLTSRILPPLTSVLPTADALRRGALDSPPLQLTSVYRGGQEFVGDSPAQPPPPPVRPYRPWGTEMAY